MRNKRADASAWRNEGVHKTTYLFLLSRKTQRWADSYCRRNSHEKENGAILNEPRPFNCGNRGNCLKC